MRQEAPACPCDASATVAAPAGPSRLKVTAAFASVYIIWGSTYLAIRIGVETLPPFSMAGIRFLIAGLLMYAVVRPREPQRPTARNWLATGIVGCLMLLGGNGLVCWAEQTVASGLAALLVATVPIWIVLLDWLIYRGPRPSRAIIFGLLVGLAGIYILIGPENLGGERLNITGSIALLLACVFWALGSVHSRRAALPRSSWLATAMEMIVGGLALLIVGAATGEVGHISTSAISLRSVLALGYLIVFGSMLGLTSYKWLLHVCPPARVATYAYVNPVIAILLGTLLAGEPLTPRVAVATAVIVAAVVIITRYTARRAPATTRTQDA